MSVLNTLREKNPGLTLHSVLDGEFAPYGRVLTLDAHTRAELFAALASTPVPEEGNSYEASSPALENTDAARVFSLSIFGSMETQSGYCNGHGRTLNAFEYHKCSEVNFTTTGLVLLLALPEDMEDGNIESSRTVGFYLPPDVPVEIYPRVLHFAPCAAAEEGFRCLVILEKGVNTPLPTINTSAPGEEKLLWMRGKWLTCHPDSPQAKKGAYQGIHGENIELK